MKNKNLQPASEFIERAFHERAGSVLVIGAMLLGLATVEHQVRNQLREAVVRPAFATLQNLERENETERMPVRLDTGLRLPSITGE